MSKNFVSFCLSGFEQKMQNEPNLKNTKINVTSLTAVNYDSFHSFAPQKNEPNTIPIYPQFAAYMLSWPAVRILSTYSGQALRNSVCNSSRPPAKTAYLYRVMNKKMQNEPNLQNNQINLNPVKTRNCENKRLAGQPKNEPKTNPFLPSNLSDEDWARLKAFAKAEKETQFMKKQTKPGNIAEKISLLQG